MLGQRGIAMKRYLVHASLQAADGQLFLDIGQEAVREQIQEEPGALVLRYV